VSVRLYPRVTAQHDIQAERWLKVRDHIRELNSFLSDASASGARVSLRGGVHILSDEAAAPHEGQGPDAAALAAVRRELLDGYLDALIHASNQLALTLPGLAEPIALPIGLPALYTTLQLARTSNGDEQLTVFAGLRQSRHLILVGPDGAGKSTTINQLAATMASAIRAPEQHPQAQQRLDGWRRGPRLPVRVLLAQAATSPGAPLDQLWAGVPELARPELRPDERELLRDTLVHTLDRGQGMLLIDGLDQVPAEATDQAHAIIRAARERFSASYILVTFRSDDYDCHAYRLNEIDSAVLAPFSPRDIEAFVARWYRELAAQGRYSAEAAQQRARSLALTIRANPRLQRQAGLPQNLAAIALMHSHGGELPAGVVKQFWLAVA
jgi:energy-coupling factor transporter ATP-binding protein EcfA2